MLSFACFTGCGNRDIKASWEAAWAAVGDMDEMEMVEAA